MSEPRSQSTTLFRTSLRSWQAKYKARQAETGAAPSEEQPAPASVTPTAAAPATPTRVKRLAPYKRRRMAAGR